MSWNINYMRVINQFLSISAVKIFDGISSKYLPLLLELLTSKGDKMKNYISMIIVVGAVLVAFNTKSVYAAEADEASINKDSNEHVIMVTARKRSEDLQDVPIAITVVSEQDIDQRGVLELIDLTKSVPNFVHNGNGSTLSATGIRGVVASTRNIGFESGMGVYIDGVYVGRPSAFNQNLDDILQLEVLRGPQGTLFGKNTIAGAINITTKKPSETMEGRIKATIGDLDRRNISGFISGPIKGDVLLGKISLYSVERDGFVNNAFDNSKLSNENRNGYRVSLVYNPNEDLEIIFNADDMEETTNRMFTQWRGTDVTSPLAGLYNFALADNPCCFASGIVPNLTAQNGDNIENRDLSGQNLQIISDLESGHTFTSISSVRNTDFLLGADDDGTPLDISHSRFEDKSDLFTQELRLDSPDNENYNYVVGLYYLNSDSSASRETRVFTPLGVFDGIPNFLNGAGVPITDAAGNLVLLEGTVASESSVDSESYAVFGSLNYNINDDTTLTVGLRYTSEEKSLQFQQINTAFTGHPNVATSPSIKDSGLSGNVALRYSFNDNMSVYASFSRGFKSGGFNPDIVPNDDIVFDQEIAHTSEIGVKSVFLDNRVRLNLAAFYTDYQDQQVQRLGVSELGGTGFQISNADSEISGLEMELNGNVTDNFEVGVSVGILDHQYKNFANCSTTEDNQVDAGGQFVLLDCAGNKLSFVPDLTYNIMAQYTTTTSVGDLFARVEYGYKGKSFSEPGNFARTAIGSSNTTDFRVGYNDPDGSIEISFWGKNISDKENRLFSWYIPAFQSSYQSFSIGAEYGVDFILNFY